MIQQNPNVAVWNSANEYIDSAEFLLDNNRLHSATVLSAVAIELLLKSFLAERIAPWTAKTQHGHSLVDLFKKIESEDQEELNNYFANEGESLGLEKGLRKYSNLFIALRYPHEPSAPSSYGSDVVYFARSLCNAVYKLGTARGA